MIWRAFQLIRLINFPQDFIKILQINDATNFSNILQSIFYNTTQAKITQSTASKFKQGCL